MHRQSLVRNTPSKHQVTLHYIKFKLCSSFLLVFWFLNFRSFGHFFGQKVFYFFGPLDSVYGTSSCKDTDDRQQMRLKINFFFCTQSTLVESQMYWKCLKDQQFFWSHQKLNSIYLIKSWPFPIVSLDTWKTFTNLLEKSS